MSDKDKKAAGCGCSDASKGLNCPCNKRICLPILGLVAIAAVVSLMAKARSRK